MALTAIELGLDAGTLEFDYQGKYAAGRRFVVETTSKQAAILADGIPAVSTSHPDFPSMLMDAYRVTVASAGVTYVDCLYSSDRRYGQTRQPNKDNPSWFWWGWSTRETTIEIPIWRRRRVLSAAAAGGSTLVYELGKFEKVEYRIVRPLRVRVKIDNVRDLDVIAAQINYLHIMPDGRTYLFLGATVQQVDDDGTYDISYEWILDEGTTYFPPFPPGDNAGYCVPIEGSLTRLPYQVFLGFQTGNPETDMPQCLRQYQYFEDYEGWRTLPGATRII
jgi:hypothetical protein